MNTERQMPKIWIIGMAGLLFAGSLVAFLALVALLALVRHDDDPGEPPGPPNEASDPARVIDAAKARIVEQSERGVRTHSVTSAPGMSYDPAPARQVRPPPSPPAGYSFAGYAGEMRKARIEGAVAADGSSDAVPDWLDSSTGVAALARQAAEAGRGWTFGWIAPGAGTTRAELTRALEGAGAEVVGGAGRLVRARLPGAAADLEAIAALGVVAGLGTVPSASKLSAFAAELPDAAAPVYVTLMEDETDGRWRQAMEALGAVVGAYDAGLRMYAANADRFVIEALAAADWVVAVEPIPVVTADHDTAVPAMGVDALRTHDGAQGLFAGTDGASVPVAVMDTGLNVAHPDIARHRDSICGANFVYSPFGTDPLVEDRDLWIDADGHGTHVTGTVAGNGFVEQRFAGMAPGARHIRFAKVLSTRGSGSSEDIRQGMDFLSAESGCDDDAGVASERVKPLIVNMSLSACALTYEGRGASARKLDAMVWSHRQLYVVAQSNANIHCFSNYGAAKNSLAVGAAMDGGELASFSSHGPTFDGRLAPNVVGTGVGVNSALGNGSTRAYRKIGGTSMSSPAVAGVAALLMDAVPAHKEHPALARARLMASAIRPEAWLAADGGFPLDNTGGPGPIQARFGLGKVSARAAVLQRDTPAGWTSGGAKVQLAGGEYAWHDIEVPVGASRLDLVMTWDEPPADAVASTVLNDLDLWLDRAGDCGAAACGERASRSRIDNVEWIVVRNPEPGTYRAKVVAHRVYTDAPRAGMAWTVIRGPSTPTLSVAADRSTLSGDGEQELTLTVSADGYVAAGSKLHIDCRAEATAICTNLVTVESVTLSREDGIAVDLAADAVRPIPSEFVRLNSPINLGASIPVGEIAAGDRREATVRVSVADDPGARASLHFTASAWNGRAGSAAVGVGSGSVLEIARPANDDFAAAAVIEGANGSATLDLLHATAEPGEPVAAPEYARPAGSVWYAWTAPSDGPFRFHVPTGTGDEGNGDVARYDHVHVFRGDEVAALREVAGGLWGATFFATEAQAYRVRVASSSRGTAMKLRWSVAERPANDDFADAVVLSGESGAIDGSSAGATLEAGESFGGLAATTWYRWTAPDDGDWLFTCPGKLVLVFEGGELAMLRLVSHSPGSSAWIPAGTDREYHIAVAEDAAGGAGGDYELQWRPSARYWGSDAFASAQIIDGGASEQDVYVNATQTVEPGEPEETGVRTRWWAWEAPADGRYTWRLGDRGENTPTYPKLRVTLFRGAAIGDLDLAAEMGPGPPYATPLDAVAGESFRVAVGLRNGDEHVYCPGFCSSFSGRLKWGATPGNDEPVGAVAVSGASGSVSGSTVFATAGEGEQDVLGTSTLWWTYEAGTSGWVRFAVDGGGGPWRLVVHRESADGGLDIVAASVRQGSEGDEVEVLFEAEEGVRYTISLGVADGSGGGDFTLRWDPTDAPARLYYAGRLSDGDVDSRGNPVEIRAPVDLVIHASGTALYLASEIGLQVFGRDAASGELNFVQLLDTGPYGEHARLLWDATRKRLLLDECGSWRSFAEVGGGPELEDLGELAVAGDPGSCGIQLAMDATGSDLYRVAERAIEHFAVDDDGGLQYAEAAQAGSARAAVLSNEGRHLYARVGNFLRVLKRDPDSGVLTWTDYLSERMDAFIWTHFESVLGALVAITDDDAHLFVFDRYGERANVFSLDDPEEPDRLALLNLSWRMFWPSYRSGWESCRFADTRGRIVAVDVFCPGMAFTAQWDPGVRELALTDFVVPGAGGVPDFDAPVALAVAPDDRHLYLATPEQGIMVFSREAPRPIEESGAADLALQRAWVSPVEPPAGSTFRLTALVRNRGTARSTAATLSFHRSADSTITTADAEVGSVPLGVLAASGTRSRSVDIVAPVTPGTYDYGACVDTAGDGGDGGACSEAIRVAVTEAEAGAPDLVVDALQVDGANPEPGASVTLNVVVGNAGEGASPATTLRYYRSDNTTVSTGDAEVGTDKVGALDAGADTDHAIKLTAPSTAGTYWYGACIDRVPAESDTGNNCSDGVEVVVSVGGDGGGDDDDHGDSAADATAVAIPSTTQGNLEEAGDRDYFRLEVAQSMTLTVQTTGTTDTVGSLFDANGVSLDSNDDGGNGTNFLIVRQAASGTYYVEVRGYSTRTGPYTLSVQGEGGDTTHCSAGGIVDPDGSCTIHGTTHTFEVDTGGEGCLNADFTLCSETSIDYRSSVLTFVAERLDDDTWEIEDVDPAPPD